MNKKIKTFGDFSRELERNPKLQNAFRADPVAAANEIDSQPWDGDIWIFRMVVGSLGLTILFIVIGVIVMQLKNGSAIEVPPIFIALGSAAIGALAGLLAPSPR